MSDFISKPLRTPKQAIQPLAKTYPVGGFEGAASYSEDRSAIFDNVSSFGDAPTYARSELLRLTRYLVNNSSVVERILTVAENYTIGGTGIYAQSCSEDPIFNQSATKYFDRWSSSVFSSVTNEINLFDIQKLCVRELLIAGEIFIVMSKADTGTPQLHLINSELVRGTGKKNDKSQDGLFISSRGVTTAYQIFFDDKNPTIVEAANVIHLKRNKMCNQRRGISAFAASLNSLRDSEDLRTLEKKSIKIHSALAATVTRKNGEVGEGLFNKGKPKKDVTEAERAKPNAALNKAFAGAIAYLHEGESVDLIQSDRSTDGFLKFMELLLRDVCMNLSISYEFIVNPTNLSSAGTRFIISDTDNLIKNLQNILKMGALDRIYSWVIASALKEGKIKPSEDKENWYAVSWVTPQSITIDQGRKDYAELSFVEANLSSLDTFYSSRGKTWNEELRQIAIEKAFISKLEKEYEVRMTSEDKNPSPILEPEALKRMIEETIQQVLDDNKAA